MQRSPITFKAGNLPLEQVPSAYQQLEDGSWLSPKAYQMRFI
ncbi:MAG: hypothetical protein V7L14_31560 [Nostoc sp.]